VLWILNDLSSCTEQSDTSKPTDAHKCTKTYYTHCIPLRCVTYFHTLTCSWWFWYRIWALRNLLYIGIWQCTDVSAVRYGDRTFMWNVGILSRLRNVTSQKPASYLRSEEPQTSRQQSVHANLAGLRELHRGGQRPAGKVTHSFLPPQDNQGCPTPIGDLVTVCLACLAITHNMSMFVGGTDRVTTFWRLFEVSQFNDNAGSPLSCDPLRLLSVTPHDCPVQLDPSQFDIQNSTYPHLVLHVSITINDKQLWRYPIGGVQRIT
jgi:hypothetical protein